MEYNWEEISAYREQEIKEAISLIHEIWKNDKSADYFRGVMDLFNRLVLLPKLICKKSEEDYIEDMVNKNFKSVEISLLREAARK